MSTKASKLKEFIRHLIRQELKELEEVSVTGNLDGGKGPPRTPYAFYGGRKKDKEKKKRIAQAGGYMKVKESVNETPQMAKQGQVGLLLKLANKQLQNVFSLHKRGNNEKAKQDFISRQAMGRLGRPEEIASFAVYLASDESEFVTGGLHVLDGGWTL